MVLGTWGYDIASCRAVNYSAARLHLPEMEPAARELMFYDELIVGNPRG